MKTLIYDMSIFKAYDIRGIYPNEINEKIAYKIARACARYFKGNNALIGGDGRISTPTLKKGLIDGLLEEGVDVYDLGIISTSTFNFIISRGNFDFGLQVTASHNPKEFNGIKVYDGLGNTIGIDFGLKKIEEIFNAMNIDNKEKDGKYIDASEMKNLHKEFLEDFIESFDQKICIDYSNGCGSIVFSDVIKNRIKAIEINKDIDGNFPAHPPEPTEENLKKLSELVKENNCSLGIAFDGDADRIAFLDENGKLIRGDRILYIFSKFLKPKKVVYEVSFPPLFKSMIEKLGIKYVESKVGRVYIINEMRKENADIGGEVSSHFYFKATNFMEDAFYAFALMIKILKKENKKISELLEEYPEFPHESFKISVPEDKKYHIVEKLKEEISKEFETITIDGVKVILDDKNWFLIRASNTEPVIRVYVEGESKEKLDKNKEIVYNFIKKFI
jgi:phosphomannomutase